jgi:hypothetical protein
VIANALSGWLPPHVTAAAIDLLRRLGGKDSGTLGAIKQTMFGPVVHTLTGDAERRN